METAGSRQDKRSRRPATGVCPRNVIRRQADKSSESAVELAKRNHALPSTYEANPGLGRIEGLVQHEAVPDLAYGFFPFQFPEDFQSVFDRASGTASGTQVSVSYRLLAEVLSSLVQQIALESVKAGEFPPLQSGQLGDNEPRCCAYGSNDPSLGEMFAHQIDQS